MKHFRQKPNDGRDTLPMYILITAHPDDEVLFFLPTLCNILCSPIRHDSNSSSSKNKIILNIICLSNGNYNGIGKSHRTQEYFQAIQLVVDTMNTLFLHSYSTPTNTTSTSSSVQIKRSDSVEISISATLLDHLELQDGPDNRWSSKCIQDVLHVHIQNLMSTIHVDNHYKMIQLTLLTFDQYGVSRHVNHIDTYHGVHSSFLSFSSSLVSSLGKSPTNTMDHHAIHTPAQKQQHLHLPQKKESIENCTIPIHIQMWSLQTVNHPFQKYIPIQAWLSFLYIVVQEWIQYFILHGRFFFFFSFPFFRKMRLQKRNRHHNPYCSVRNRFFFSSSFSSFSHSSSYFDSHETWKMIPRIIMTMTIMRWRRERTRKEVFQQDLWKCQMFLPTLSWKAMATHQSQFVWYRRLFVLLSQYTFVNSWICHGTRKVDVPMRMNVHDNKDGTNGEDGTNNMGWVSKDGWNWKTVHYPWIVSNVMKNDD